MDFEGASIAPPELDLGWWLFFDRTMHEGAGTERAPGDPTRAAQREIYAEASRRDLGDLHWFEVLAGVKYSSIVVRVMNRAADRGEIGPNGDFWRHNMIVDCLTDVLGE
jgi:aminoglycoside phosphotransferase (APT) family kinase protein